MPLLFRYFLRDWRTGELTALLLALSVAVASVTSVGFFSDRVRQAMTLNANQFLGGDLLVSADQPLPDGIKAEASARGLALAEGMAFVSMARSRDGTQLASVKAVGPGYPLRGRLRIALTPDQAGTVVNHVPPPGSVWVDPRFVSLTGVQVGDSLDLGDARLTVSAILAFEPDRGFAFMNLAPRVMLNLADVPSTGLVQPGSRIRYQIYLAGNAGAVESYRAWLEPRLTRGQKMEGLHDRPEIQRGLSRAQSFLGLTAMLAVILAAVAVLMATRRYVERHYDSYALMRCLGAVQGRLLRLFGAQILFLGGLAGVVGSGLGYAVQGLIGLLLGDLLTTGLPSPSVLPAMQGVVTGFILLLGFALPPLLQLRTVPALRVIRREAGLPGSRALLAYLLGFTTLSALLIWQAGDLRLAAHVIAGFLAALGLFALCALATLRLATHARRRASFTWRYGVASLHRRSSANIIQIIALALGISAILLMSFTRNDLVGAWLAKAPADAPNRFMLNIQPEQQEAVRTFFRNQNITEPHLYPMVRGRLTAINGQPVRAEQYPDDRARRLVEREFNLSHMAHLPVHNQVIAGRWQASSKELSIESGIADTLKIKLGDQLTWTVAGEEFTAPVTSVRRLDWDSMQVNFFIIATPELLSQYPASYISSFRVEPSQRTSMNELVRTFPNLTVIDVTATLEQVLSLTERMIAAVQLVFMIALAAGVLVLYTALLSTQDERIREATLMRALGASRKKVVAAQRIEHMLIGLLAGVLASAGATAIGALLALRVFEFDRYVPDPWIWLAGPSIGLLCVAFNTWLITRSALGTQTPWQLLREQ